MHHRQNLPAVTPLHLEDAWTPGIAPACAACGPAPEERFDRLTRLAARVLDTPFAMIGIAERERVWFKSRQGLDIEEAPRNITFCTHALEMTEALVVEDAAEDARFANNPLVTGEPFIRFYAGAQLRAHDGAVLGTLCVLDRRPRRLSRADIVTLEDLAQSVTAELELRRLTRALQDQVLEQARFSQQIEAGRLRAEHDAARLADVLSTTSDMHWETDADMRLVVCRGGLGLETVADEVLGRTLFEVASATGRGQAALENMVAHVKARRSFRQLEFSYTDVDGAVMWLEVSGKPIFGTGAVLTGYCGLIRDITARKLAEAQVRAMAEQDPLTGLPNRRVFAERLDHVLESASPGGVFVLDIDHFKQVNDTYGHDVGDRLVQAVAHRVAEQVRSGDVVARLGGDEFAVILEGAGPDQVREIAERICRCMERPFLIDDLKLQGTLSLGAVLTPEHAADAAAVFRHADAALYAAKHAGRGGWTMYGG